MRISTLTIPESRLQATWRAAVVAVLMVAVVISALTLVPPFLANVAVQQANRAAEEAYLDEAAAHLQRAIGWTPKHAGLRQMLGQVYMRMALFRTPRSEYVEKAIVAYREAARLNPHDAYTFTLMGWTYLYGGDASGAEAAFLQARTLDPNNPRIRYGLGTAYLWHKKIPEARAEFAFVQAYFPGAPELQAAWDEIERLTTAR